MIVFVILVAEKKKKKNNVLPFTENFQIHPMVATRVTSLILFFFFVLLFVLLIVYIPPRTIALLCRCLSRLHRPTPEKADFQTLTFIQEVLAQ